MRGSLVAAGLAVLATAVVQVLQYSPVIPAENLRLAWGLTRVLIQL